VRLRSLVGTVAVVGALIVPAVAVADSTGTVSGLRAQVTRLITAELAKDTATVCAIVAHPRKTCEQHWQKSLTHLLRHGGRHMLNADLEAVPGAAVTSDGYSASITLPHPLRDDQSNFSWYDDCWMLSR
jgi:hypothetical protein